MLAPSPVPGPRATPLLATDLARVYDVRCAGHDSRREEAARTHELVLVRRGAFAWRDARGRATADAAHALLARAGAPYTVSHVAPAGDRCTVIAFDSDVDTRAPLRLLPPTAHLLHRRLAAVHALGPLAREELVAALLDAALTPTAAPRTGARAATRAAHAAVVARVREKLTADPARAWTLGALARHAGASPFHLARVFRAHVGLPVHRYQRRLRLLLALERWGADGVGGTAAALDAGFASHAHFSAAFRAEFGAPPTRAAARETSKILEAGARRRR